jgi:hypothetical protein
MSQHYEAFLARGQETIGGPVGYGVVRSGGEIALELGVIPVGPHFHLVLRPADAGAEGGRP